MISIGKWVHPAPLLTPRDGTEPQILKYPRLLPNVNINQLALGKHSDKHNHIYFWHQQLNKAVLDLHVLNSELHV